MALYFIRTNSYLYDISTNSSYTYLLFNRYIETLSILHNILYKNQLLVVKYYSILN